MNYLSFPEDSPESIAMWTIGLDGRHHPYYRHGKLYYKPWKNRFASLPGGYSHKVLENLAARGLADSQRQGGYDDDQIHETFWLTRAGLDWLGEQLGITIHSM